tara:strand:+ start:39 stop:509 length:471 start_codon:yes stop_codon:yes gene_type:complete
VKNKLTFKIIILISFFSLLFAFFLEYVLGHKPCNLCLMQRVPYLGSLILASLALVLKKYDRICLILITLLFIFGGMVSFYHVGIEQGFFNESIVCNLSGDQNILSTDSLLNQLEKASISCKNITFKFFGLSLATINTIFSSLISVKLIHILYHAKN